MVNGGDEWANVGGLSTDGVVVGGGTKVDLGGNIVKVVENFGNNIRR